MHSWKRAIFAAVILGSALAACVLRTEHKIDAHIRLDIRHVRDEADSLYDVISGEKDVSEVEGEEPQAMVVKPLEAPGMLARLFDVTTVAAAADDRIDFTPEMLEIAKRMQKRFAALKAAKNEGCVGEDNSGFVKFRACAKAERDRDHKKEIESLIEAENRDRRALYAAHAENVDARSEAEKKKVRLIWADEWRENSLPGHWFETPDSGEHFDEFEDTKLGKALEKAEKSVKPKTWYQVPSGYKPPK